MKEFIDSLKADGHTIIINTARNMQTQGHNVGKVLKNVGKITLDWLEENGIQYDEIFFGKPNADITIDDRVMKFEDWRKMDKEGMNSLIDAAYRHSGNKYLQDEVASNYNEIQVKLSKIEEEQDKILERLKN